MSWAWRVLRTGENLDAYKVLVGKPEKMDHFFDLGVGGSIILKRMLEKEDVEMCDRLLLPR
jgi:hypothetical protein